MLRPGNAESIVGNSSLFGEKKTIIIIPKPVFHLDSILKTSATFGKALSLFGLFYYKL